MYGEQKSFWIWHSCTGYIPRIIALHFITARIQWLWWYQCIQGTGKGEDNQNSAAVATIYPSPRPDRQWLAYFWRCSTVNGSIHLCHLWQNILQTYWLCSLCTNEWACCQEEQSQRNFDTSSPQPCKRAFVQHAMQINNQWPLLPTWFNFNSNMDK